MIQAGRVSATQAAALVRLLLGQMLRKGISPATSAMIHPLRSIVLNLGVVGVFFSFNAGSQDLATYMRWLFAGALGMVIVTLEPETSEARARLVDALGVRPVSAATFFISGLIARTVVLLVSVAAFTAIPLIAAAARLDLSVGAAVAAAALLALMAFAMASLWLHAYAAAVQRVRPETLRRANQAIAVVILLSIIVASSGLGSSLAASAPRAVDFMAPVAAMMAHVLPSTWFADALTVPATSVEWAQRAGLVLVLCLAFMPLVGDRERRGRAIADALARAHERSALRPQVLRRGAATWLVDLARPLLHPQAHGIARAITLHSERDEGARIRRIANAVLAGIGAIIALVLRIRSLGEWLVVYTCFVALIEGLDAARRSPDGAAAWIFFTVRASPKRILAGSRLAALVTTTLLPLACLALILFVARPPVEALACLLAMVVLLRGSAALYLAARPAMPLADNGPQLMPALGAGLALIFSAGVTVMLAIVGSVVGLGWSGALVIAAVVGLTCLLTLGLDLAAARRVAALEHRY